MHRSKRILGGLVVAIVLLGAVPATVFAATPSCGDTLMANTTFTSNLDCSGYSGTALTLGKDGIILNLNGYTLTGPAGDDSYTGIYTEYKNDTITNGTVTDFDINVEGSYASNLTISWITSMDGTGDPNDYGIYVQYSVGTKVNHNTVSDAYEGIYLYGCASSVVKWNTSSASDSAFYFYYDSKDLIAHNTASSSAYGFYDYYNGAQRYQHNTATGNANEGFYLYCDEAGQITVLNNTATGNGGDGFYTYYCYVEPPGRPRLSLISGNTANGNGGSGFDDDYSIGATFSWNTAKNNGDDGLYMDYPGDIRIVNNITKGNTDSGIELADNTGVGYGIPKTVSGNTMKGNAYGFYAGYGLPNGVCTGNVIKNNTTANVTGAVCN